LPFYTGGETEVFGYFEGKVYGALRTIVSPVLHRPVAFPDQDVGQTVEVHIGKMNVLAEEDVERYLNRRSCSRVEAGIALVVQDIKGRGIGRRTCCRECEVDFAIAVCIVELRPDVIKAIAFEIQIIGCRQPESRRPGSAGIFE